MLVNLTVQNDITGTIKLNASFSCTILRSAVGSRFRLSNTGDQGSAVWVDQATDVWIENFIVDVPWLNTTGTNIRCQTPYYKYNVQNCLLQRQRRRRPHHLHLQRCVRPLPAAGR